MISVGASIRGACVYQIAPLRVYSSAGARKPVRLTNRPPSKTHFWASEKPITSATISSPSKAKKTDRQPTRFWKKALIGLFGSTFLIYLGDSYLGHGIVERNVRSISTLIALSVDYKMHFQEDYDVDALHERNAQRLYDLILENKGLYIKLGQMIAVQGTMFPKHYQDKFKMLFDRAPVEPWSTCDMTLRKELGQDYQEKLFQSIEKEPVASASIAQVHQAVLKNGEKVAVKIQKNSVSRQMESDLFTYRYVMYFYGWLFEMPLEKTVNYVCDKMREELNFKKEYQNAKMITKLIEDDDEFSKSQQYYIPKYYGDISSAKILISEWMDAQLVSKYQELSDYGFNLKILLTQITKIYARQVFTWGLVHCDLHPGNLMVRNIEVENYNWLTSMFWRRKNIQQLVILDHGLYENFTPKFKRQYAEFWKYSMEKHYDKTKEVLSSWGIEVDEMTMTLIGIGDRHSPLIKEHVKKVMNMTYFQRQLMLKEKMKEFFQNTDKFPLCLVFVMRSMRILQGLNRNFGAPVNRLALLVDEANKSVEHLILQTGEADNWKDYFTRKYVSLTVKVVSNILFSINKTYIWLCNRISNLHVQNLEDAYDEEIVAAGQMMGFESVPSSKELIV